MTASASIVELRRPDSWSGIVRGWREGDGLHGGGAWRAAAPDPGGGSHTWMGGKREHNLSCGLKFNETIS